MQKLQSTWSGQHVTVRGEAWRVVQTEPFARSTVVTLRGAEAQNLGETTRLIAPFDDLRPSAPRGAGRSVSTHSAMRVAAAAILDAPPWWSAATTATARLDLRPWQLEPAMAALGGTSRLMLGDAVGLGKTVQAWLVIAELLARGLVQRVLILTPASLREQWAEEGASRFGLRPVVVDQATLGLMQASLPVGVNPWKTAPLMVASIDLVKRAEVRTALDEVPLDALIVDEAHHLTVGSDRLAVVSDLAARTPFLVLVTATPHSGHPLAFRALRAIGDVAGRDDMRLFRRSRRVADRSGPRRFRILPVTPTSTEHALLQATVAYGKAVWSGRASTPAARLVASVLARRAVSSPAAALRTLGRRLSLLTGHAPPAPQPGLPWDDEACDDDVTTDAVLGVPGLADAAREAEWLRRLIHLAEAAAGHHSKVRVIRRLLRRTHEHLIVFSEYRDVVEQVASSLRTETTVAVIHGGLSVAARRDAVHAFTHGLARVLATTDAAGEGLNLHARCRAVVNLELPWSPLRIEQRVGRVDRIGQTRRVHALQLVYRQSFEEHVLTRLDARRQRIDGALGEAATLPDDGAVAAMVFEGRALPGSSRDDSPAQTDQTDLHDWMQVVRRLQRLTHRAGPSRLGPVIGRRRRNRRAIRVVMLVFAADLLDGAGRLTQREVVPIRIGLTPSTTRLSRARVADLVTSPRVRAVLTREVERRTRCVEERIAPARIAFEQRLDDLCGAIDHRRAARLYQGSLFDRRAEQRAHSSRAAIRSLVDSLERHQASIRALASLQARTPELVAAWAEA